MTKKEAIKNHRDMWNWIADQIEKDKELKHIEDLKQDYCNDYTSGDYCIQFNCFCCEYAKISNDYNFNCNSCPVEWPSTTKEFMCEYKNNKSLKIGDCDGLWIECADMVYSPKSYTWEEQAKLARQIANLPERED